MYFNTSHRHACRYFGCVNWKWSRFYRKFCLTCYVLSVKQKSKTRYYVLWWRLFMFLHIFGHISVLLTCSIGKWCVLQITSLPWYCFSFNLDLTLLSLCFLCMCPSVRFLTHLLSLQIVWWTVLIRKIWLHTKLERTMLHFK